MSIISNKPNAFTAKGTLAIKNGTTVHNITVYAGNPNGEVLSPNPQVGAWVIDTLTGNIYKYLTGTVYKELGAIDPEVLAEIGDNSTAVADLLTRMVAAEANIDSDAQDIADVEARVDSLEADKASIEYVDLAEGSLQDQINDILPTVTAVENRATNIEASIHDIDDDILLLQSNKADNTYVDAADSNLQNQIDLLESSDQSWNWSVRGLAAATTGDANIFSVQNIEKDISYFMTVRAPMTLELRGPNGTLHMHNSLGNTIQMFGFDTDNKKEPEDQWPVAYFLLPGEYRLNPGRDGTLILSLYAYSGYPEVSSWASVSWDRQSIIDNQVFRWNGTEPHGEDKGSI